MCDFEQHVPAWQHSMLSVTTLGSQLLRAVRVDSLALRPGAPWRRDEQARKV